MDVFRFLIGFLQGPKRKAGLLTLVLALFFLMFWIRASVVRDQIAFAIGEDAYSIEFSPGTASFRQFCRGKPCRQMWTTNRQDRPTTAPIHLDAPYIGYGCDGRTGEWWYLRREDVIDPNCISRNRDQWQMRRFRTISVPMWGIVMPMTLASLWLLLSEQRQSSQTKAVQQSPSVER